MKKQVQRLAQLYKEILALSQDEFKLFEVEVRKRGDAMLHSVYKQVANKRDNT